MKKMVNQTSIKKRTKKTTEPALRKPKYNRVQIYDLHQVLLFDLSCNQCANKERCSETKQNTYCEIDEVITKSGVFDIKVQVQGTENSKYYVYTDGSESLDVTNSAVAKIKKQYSR